MEQEFASDLNPTVRGEMAWAGVEATRALRGLNRNEDADDLSSILETHFADCDSSNIKCAIAWATAERSNTYANAGNFISAAEYCLVFIEHADRPDLDQGMEWPLAWAYAQAVRCWRKSKSYEQAISACDRLLARFGDRANPDIQYEMAFALLEKAAALRSLRRLVAATTVAKDVIARFGGSRDSRIVRECVWAVHAEGDALLGEAKLLLREGFDEDACAKLREARERFADAWRRDPRSADHLQCKYYAEFLLGEKRDAEKTLETALSLGPITWLDGDWPELSSLTLPLDTEFQKSLECWINTRHR